MHFLVIDYLRNSRTKVENFEMFQLNHNYVIIYKALEKKKFDEIIS